MKVEFDTNSYAARIRRNARGGGAGDYFHTFVNRDSLAAGIMVLKPGSEDTQEPHRADEVYYVVSGDGFLRIRDRDYAVSPGMSYFVKGGVPHRFHGNSRELCIVYFFGGSDDG